MATMSQRHYGRQFMWAFPAGSAAKHFWYIINPLTTVIPVFIRLKTWGFPNGYTHAAYLGHIPHNPGVDNYDTQYTYSHPNLYTANY